MWTAIIVAALGVYLLKLAGLCVPKSVLERPRVREISTLLPVTLLAALVAVQTFSTGQRLTLDARAVGFGVAVIAVIFRAPFLVVVALAAASAALLRLLW
jgi:hypothetical protein